MMFKSGYSISYRSVMKRDILVSIVCIVFLLMTLGSAGGRGRRRAKEAICVANLRRWGKVIHTIVQDNGGSFPDRGDLVWWPETLCSYYDGRVNLLLCPEATKSWYEGAINPHMAWRVDMEINNQGMEVTGSYGINFWLSNQSQSEFWRTMFFAGNYEVPMFGDAQWTNVEAQPWDEPSPYESDFWTPNWNEMQRFCINRHNGVNLVYMDLSVRKIGLKHLWTQRWHRQWPDMGTAENPLPVWPEWMSNFKDPE